MKVRVPHYYDTFACTGSKCPDTCCVGWMIEIDENSYQRFMKMDGEFGERIRANIIEREDGHFFALNECGRCVFLNQDNLCEMVIKLGEQSLCSLCDNYPRVGVEYGDLREMGLSISCPEVARLILSSTREIRFGEWYQEDPVTGPDYTKDVLFHQLTEARDVLFGILQNRKLSIKERLALYIMYASQIQNILDSDEQEKMVSHLEKVMEQFSDEDYLKKAAGAMKQSTDEDCAAFMKNLCGFINSLEIINGKWKDIFGDILKNSQDGNCEWMQESLGADWDYAFEHLMVYYVFRYFLKMVFDGDIYSKAVMCAVAVMMTYSMAISHKQKNKTIGMDDMVRIFYLFSKEIEHCEENMERLADEFWDNDQYQPVTLIPIIAKIM